MATAEQKRQQITELKADLHRLKKVIPQIRHTVSKHQAIKKRKRLDYTIGRMVFFSEDFKTAAAIEKQKRKAGEI